MEVDENVDYVVFLSEDGDHLVPSYGTPELESDPYELVVVCGLNPVGPRGKRKEWKIRQKSHLYQKKQLYTINFLYDDQHDNISLFCITPERKKKRPDQIGQWRIAQLSYIDEKNEMTMK